MVNKITKDEIIIFNERKNVEIKVAKRINYIKDCIKKYYKNIGSNKKYYDEILDDLRYKNIIIKDKIKVNLYLKDAYFELNNKEINLSKEIPSHWLWEDFEEELKNGIEKYKNNKDFYDTLRKNDLEFKQRQKKEKINKAINKLSEEERRLLKIKRGK